MDLENLRRAVVPAVEQGVVVENIHCHEQPMASGRHLVCLVSGLAQLIAGGMESKGDQIQRKQHTGQSMLICPQSKKIIMQNWMRGGHCAGDEITAIQCGQQPVNGLPERFKSLSVLKLLQCEVERRIMRLKVGPVKLPADVIVGGKLIMPNSVQQTPVLCRSCNFR